MTTEFPLERVSEEEFHQGVGSVVPRTANREADALANGRTEDFSPEYEQRLDPTGYFWNGQSKWDVQQRAAVPGVQGLRTEHGQGRQSEASEARGASPDRRPMVIE